MHSFCPLVVLKRGSYLEAPESDLILGALHKRGILCSTVPGPDLQMASSHFTRVIHNAASQESLIKSAEEENRALRKTKSNTCNAASSVAIQTALPGGIESNTQRAMLEATPICIPKKRPETKGNRGRVSTRISRSSFRRAKKSGPR